MLWQRQQNVIQYANNFHCKETCRISEDMLTSSMFYFPRTIIVVSDWLIWSNHVYLWANSCHWLYPFFYIVLVHKGDSTWWVVPTPYGGNLFSSISLRIELPLALKWPYSGFLFFFFFYVVLSLFSDIWWYTWEIQANVKKKKRTKPTTTRYKIWV